jgi:hypothetical protein
MSRLLLVAGVLVVALVVACGGGGGASDEDGGPKKVEAGPRPIKTRIGQETAIGDWRVTLTRVTRSTAHFKIANASEGKILRCLPLRTAASLWVKDENDNDYRVTRQFSRTGEGQMGGEETLPPGRAATDVIEFEDLLQRRTLALRIRVPAVQFGREVYFNFTADDIVK